MASIGKVSIFYMHSFVNCLKFFRLFNTVKKYDLQIIPFYILLNLSRLTPNFRPTSFGGVSVLFENLTQIFLRPSFYTGLEILDTNIIRTNSFAVESMGSIFSTQLPYGAKTIQIHN